MNRIDSAVVSGLILHRIKKLKRFQIAIKLLFWAEPHPGSKVTWAYSCHSAIVKQGIKLCQKTRHYGLWARDMHVE